MVHKQLSHRERLTSKWVLSGTWCTLVSHVPTNITRNRRELETKRLGHDSFLFRKCLANSPLAIGLFIETNKIWDVRFPREEENVQYNQSRLDKIGYNKCLILNYELSGGQTPVL